MDVSAKHIYRLTAAELREQCIGRGLDCGGPVRSLRRRLVDHIRNANMDEAQDKQNVQAGVLAELVSNGAGPGPAIEGHVTHGGDVNGQAAVLVELLRSIPPLCSDEPTEIMRLFVRLDEVYDLKLVMDSEFVIRIMPLVRGSLLRFFGICLRERCSWAESKSRLLDEYFPYFVRERLIRDLIIFNFQGEGQNLREYIGQVWQVAKFLEYDATEQQLVDRVVMNLHPHLLTQAALLGRPRSLQELYGIVTIIEEKCAVTNERQRVKSDRRCEGSIELGPGNASREPVRKMEAPVRVPVKCWCCGRLGHVKRNCYRKFESEGIRRRDMGLKGLCSLQKIAAVPPDTPLWVMLELQVGQVPALVDTGAQFSCVRSDVAEYLYLKGEPCSLAFCSLSCLLADGSKCEVKNAVKLHVKLLNFSWDHEFKVLKEGLFPAIIDLDFLNKTKMVVDVASRSYSFGFAPDRKGVFVRWDKPSGGEQFLQNLCDEASKVPTPNGVGWSSIVVEFPGVFSSTLGTARCSPYEIELCDSTPVRSPPYRCGPPKMAIFRKMVDELLENGLVRPSKSPYASPAFLVPKAGGEYRMVVDYRKVNGKIVFYSYSMPTIEQAFEQFGGAVVFSVLDLNSSYYQIPLSHKSRRITVFCTPFGLFEFNKLPMGISIGCQGLSRVIDELFADLKGSTFLIS